MKTSIAAVLNTGDKDYFIHDGHHLLKQESTDLVPNDIELRSPYNPLYGEIPDDLKLKKFTKTSSDETLYICTTGDKYKLKRVEKEEAGGKKYYYFYVMEKIEDE